MSYGNNPMYQFMRNAETIESIAAKREEMEEERSWTEIEAGYGINKASHLAHDPNEQVFTERGLWQSWDKMSRSERMACIEARRAAEIDAELRRALED